MKILMIIVLALLISGCVDSSKCCTPVKGLGFNLTYTSDGIDTSRPDVSGFTEQQRIDMSPKGDIR